MEKIILDISLNCPVQVEVITRQAAEEMLNNAVQKLFDSGDDILYALGEALWGDIRYIDEDDNEC